MHYMYIYIRKDVHIIHEYSCMDIHTQNNTHTHTHKQTNKQTHTTCSDIKTHTHTHTHIHTHTHTTCSDIRALLRSSACQCSRLIPLRLRERTTPPSACKKKKYIYTHTYISMRISMYKNVGGSQTWPPHHSCLCIYTRTYIIT